VIVRPHPTVSTAKTPTPTRPDKNLMLASLRAPPSVATRARSKLIWRPAV